jgi:hypothetical protein
VALKNTKNTKNTERLTVEETAEDEERKFNGEIGEIREKEIDDGWERMNE